MIVYKLEWETMSQHSMDTRRTIGEIEAEAAEGDEETHKMDEEHQTNKARQHTQPKTETQYSLYTAMDNEGEEEDAAIDCSNTTITKKKKEKKTKTKSSNRRNRRLNQL